MICLLFFISLTFGDVLPAISQYGTFGAFDQIPVVQVNPNGLIGAVSSTTVWRSYVVEDAPAMVMDGSLANVFDFQLKGQGRIASAPQNLKFGQLYSIKISHAPGYENTTVSITFSTSFSGIGIITLTPCSSFGFYQLLSDGTYLYPLLSVASSGSNALFTEFGTTATEVPGSADYDQVNAKAYLSGTTVGSFPGYTLIGGRDIFMARIDVPTGTVETIRQYGWAGATIDWPNVVYAPSSGDYFLCGSITGAALPTQSIIGGRDGFAIRLAANGTVLWYKQVGVNSDDQFYTCAYDDAEDMLYTGSATFLQYPGSIGYGGGIDAMLLKLNGTNGGVVWSRQCCFGPTDIYSTIAIDQVNGYIYASGYMNGGAFPGYVAGGAFDMQTCMYARNGTRISCGQVATAASETAQGSALDLVTDSLYVMSDTGILAKYRASTLQLLFFRTLGYSVSAIAIDQISHNYFLIGLGGSIFSGVLSYGGTDFLVSKYNSSDINLWNINIGSSGNEGYVGPNVKIAYVDPTRGTLSIAGSTTGAFPGQTYQGNTDMSLITLGTCTTF